MLRPSSALCVTPVNFTLKYGSRAFAVSTLKLWNKLPDYIHSFDNLNLSKCKHKTRLFKNYFNMYEFFSYPCQEPKTFDICFCEKFKSL